MATRAVVCPECGAEVPAGRLSCAACGTLLAAVAGAPKRAVAPGSEPVDAAGTSAPGARDASAADWKMGMDAAEDVPVPPILRDWTGPMPAGVVTPTSPSTATAPAASAWTPPAWTSAALPAPEPAAAEPPPAASVEADDSWDARPDVEPPDDFAAVDAPSAPGAGRTGPAAGPTGQAAGPTSPTAAPLPGAYVAPTIVPSAASSSGGRPATAASIAAAAVTDGTVTSVPASARPDRWFSVPPAASTDPTAPGKAGLFSDLPFRTPKDVAGWVVAVGSLFATIAFLLPWSANGVIGSQGEQTYTGQWGLANPADLVPMAAAIALLLLTLIPNRIPAAIRGGVLPILVGGWFLGITWIYATGAFGLGWGVDAVGIGGLLLVLGGALAAVRGDRAAVPGSGPDHGPA